MGKLALFLCCHSPSFQVASPKKSIPERGVGQPEMVLLSELESPAEQEERSRRVMPGFDIMGWSTA